ncbi:hypothetical protein B0H16DRAFT_1543417 [Mycena metata]|uniref:Uncharacterized protein n=1 Tax=Mycena metata TaxID=1033252 RepID=A0AAD7NBN7_9AGAR|nr:hypothetical protein B0H16DRAFT_1543417 [Mycena metata]
MASTLCLALLILCCTSWILALQSLPAISLILPILTSNILLITILFRASRPTRFSKFVKGGSLLHQCCSSGFQVDIEQGSGTQITQW